MKQILNLAALLLVAIVTMTSCSSDDDEKSINLAENVSGKYTGYSSVAFKYCATPYTYISQTVQVTANSDGTANVTLANDTWGTFVMTNAIVTQSGSSFVVSGKGSVEITSHGNTSSYDFTGELTIDSKKSATYAISIPSVMGGTSLTFASGEAPTSWNLVGTYKGKSSVIFKYITTPMEYENDSLSVTVNADNTLNISLENETWGTYTASNMTVELANGAYTFNGEGTVSMGMTEESKKDYPFTATGTVDATTKVATVVFTVPSVMGGTTLTYTSSPVE